MRFLNLNPRPDPARCAALLLAGWLVPAGATAQDHDHAAPEAEGGAPHFTLRGFSNVDFGAPWGASDNAPGTGNSAFALGQFDLYMISRLSPNISFLGETVFELNENQESGVDVERLQVRYSYSDRFRAALGRGHTPLGFWNEAYHHGALLEPTVDRPEALKFEDDGGILPVHFVGLEVSGKAPLAGGDLGYVAAVANGRGAVPDLVQGAYDANKSKAVVAKLDLSLGSEHALAFGPSVYHDTIPEDLATPGGHAPLGELILGAHLVYRDRRFDLFSEYFHIRHESETTHERFTNESAYAIGVAHFGKWSPYAGIDWMDLDSADPFYGPAYSDLTRVLAGVRYDLIGFNALKLEYRHEDRPIGVSHIVVLQSAFTF